MPPGTELPQSPAVWAVVSSEGRDKPRKYSASLETVTLSSSSSVRRGLLSGQCKTLGMFQLRTRSCGRAAATAAGRGRASAAARSCRAPRRASRAAARAPSSPPATTPTPGRPTTGPGQVHHLQGIDRDYLVEEYVWYQESSII